MGVEFRLFEGQNCLVHHERNSIIQHALAVYHAVKVDVGVQFRKQRKNSHRVSGTDERPKEHGGQPVKGMAPACIAREFD